MELGSAHKNDDAADTFLSIMDTMQRRMEQLHTRLQQTEERISAPPATASPLQDQRDHQLDRTWYWNRRLTIRLHRDDRSNRRQTPVTSQGQGKIDYARREITSFGKSLQITPYLDPVSGEASVYDSCGHPCIDKVMRQYTDVFDDDLSNLGHCDFTWLTVDVNVHKPIRRRAYTTPLPKRKVVDNQDEVEDGWHLENILNFIICQQLQHRATFLRRK